MKIRKIIPLTLLALSLNLLSSCSPTYVEGDKGEVGDKGGSGNDGKDGLNGKDGVDGTTLLNGNGVPSLDLGKLGDLYLNVINGDIYKKEEASWIKISNIYGEDGSDGSDAIGGVSEGKTAYSSSILPSYGGKIVPNSGSRFENEDITFYFIPDEGNSLKEITINEEVINGNDERIKLSEDNVYSYETTMVKNGFVVSAIFLDSEGNEILPSSGGNQNYLEPLVSTYVTYNEEFDLKLGSSPFYQFNEDDIESYYSSIDFSADSEELTSSLFELLKTGAKHLDYRATNNGYSSSSAYFLTDRDYSLDPLTKEEVEANKWKDKDVIVDPLYVEDHPSWNGNFSEFNREHIWAKSRGFSDYEESYAGTDLHHLRLADPSTNSARRNKFFDNKITSTTWYPPSKSDRGDLARAIFYMAVRYSKYEENSPWLKLVENPTEVNCTTAETKDKPAEFGVLSTLLARNKEDPVSEFELGRNNFVYNVQGNRNPFIDYPELADILFA